MVKKITFIVLASFISFSISARHMYWGANGHRIVGEIATSHLNCKAKKQIRRILGTESIAITSNWADFIKSDTTMRHLDPWHYINIKSGLNYADFTAALQKDTATDAYTKLNFLIKELKKGSLDAMQKRFYLRLLIHIVGDVHQPLHVGRAEDLGGNRIKVFWFNEATNLHSVWDDKIIEMQKLSYTEYTKNINHTVKQQKRDWQKQAISEWFFESYQLADKVYASVTQPDQKLGYRYNYDYIDMLNLQLLKGGVRLAGVLNDIFG
ncbi:MAG: S1/P1 nuclease [Saprospiraceae bacterium]|nr:S1/P1 nuclease [Saprospiraceae bacterium]